MVTPEEMKNRQFTIDSSDMSPKKGLYQVTDGEMASFLEGDDELGLMISDVVDDYVEEHHLKPKYDKLEELTHLSASTIKQSINDKMRITRNTLYKLSVGLKLPLEKANELFLRCGGVLKQDNKEDFICLKAIEDKDDIITFIDQYNHYTNGPWLKKLYE